MIHFLNGDTLPVFDHPYNTTALNERGVELAMFFEFFERRTSVFALGDVLEVGNVLSHYGRSPGGRVVDRFEEAPGVENIDVFDIEGTYDTIVSVSTVEHVGRDDGTESPNGGWHAILHLRSLLADGGRFFCTFPTGWNQRLDIFLGSGFVSRQSLSSHFFVRLNGDWVERERNDCNGYEPLPYGVTQPWAEGVWVGEFGPL